MGRYSSRGRRTALVGTAASPVRHGFVARRERSSATLEHVTDVHQCPHCELRFLSRNELSDHMALEHPRAVDDDTAELDDQQQRGTQH
jgi:hypothetical protein